MSIAFSWKPMLWDAQGEVMRGRGEEPVGEEAPL